MDKEILEKEVIKAVRYYFNGLSAKEAASKTLEKNRDEENNMEEKIAILKRCGFEDVEAVLDRFKKENKLKHDRLVAEIELWKSRGKNTILLYCKNGEVINRYSKETLESKSIDELIESFKSFLDMELSK